MKNKVSFSSLKVDEVLSETQYYKVAKKSGDKIQLINDSGESIVVDKNYAENCLTSAHQFDSEQKITKSEMATLLLNSSNVAITVNYNKQIKEEDVKDQITNLYPNKGGKLISESEFKRGISNIIKSVVTGEERTIVGRHYGEVTELGRIQFVDMEATRDKSKSYDTRLRQVDPRTVNWMIIKGVKYSIKK